MASKISLSRYLGDNTRLVLPLTDRATGAAFKPAGHRLLFTLKLAAGLPDADALVQKSSAVGGITVLASPDIGVDLVPADFAKLRAEVAYVIDVQAQNLTSGAIKTVCKGSVTFDEDVTKAAELTIATYTTTPAALILATDIKRGVHQLAAGDYAAIAVAFAAAYAVAPTIVDAWLVKKAGEPSLRATVNHDTITAAGFTVDLSSPVPDGATLGDYRLHWLAIA